MSGVVEQGWDPTAVVGIVAIVAAVLALLAANFVLFSPAEMGTAELYTWALQVGVLVAVPVAIGVWLRSDRGRAAYLVRVVGWAFIGGLSLGGGGVLDSFGNPALATTVPALAEQLVVWASGGLFAGTMLSIYDAERLIERERANRSRKEVEQLASGLSVINRVLRHDLRNHATVLEGQLELIDDDSEQVRIMRQHVWRIVELSEQARNMETILRADDRTPVDASAVVREVATEVQDQYPAAEIDLDCPGEAPVMAHGLLDTAVANVVENAVVHNEDPEPSVEVTVAERDGMVDIRVSDDGPGIPDHELAIRDHATESALEHSNGLGLWLVDWFAERSDGDLTIEAGEDGSEVALSLPRA